MIDMVDSRGDAPESTNGGPLARPFHRPEHAMPDITRMPAAAALKAYLAEEDQLGDYPVVVLEGGYFLPGDPIEEDRMIHLEESFWLLDQLQALGKGRRPQILLTALTSDFSTAVRPKCSASDQSKPEIPVPAWAERIYLRHAVHAKERSLEVFSMKTTRNRMTKAIARALKGERPLGVPLREVPQGQWTRIYADTAEDDVYLGCRRDSPLGLSVCCAALMAQHYHDLSKHALRVVPHATNLWIIDFNWYLESEKVQAGAMLSFALYRRPTNLNCQIVNCIYFPGWVSLRPVRITSWPNGKERDSSGLLPARFNASSTDKSQTFSPSDRACRESPCGAAEERVPDASPEDSAPAG